MSDNRSESLVKVRILDKDYSIRSEDDDKVRHIADYINKVINEIEENSPVLDRIDLPIIAAFKIASEYFSLIEDYENLKKEYESELSDLEAKIEIGLSDSPVGGG